LLAGERGGLEPINRRKKLQKRPKFNEDKALKGSRRNSAMNGNLEHPRARKLKLRKTQWSCQKGGAENGLVPKKLAF